VNTLCSYSATSLPSVSGVSRSRESCSRDDCRERPDGDEAIGSALRLDLLGRLAERQRFRLCEHVRQQHVVVPTERVQAVLEGDEVTGNERGSLMDQLVEGMLPVGARLSPVDGPVG
jgi:hypothetical protein